MAGKFLEFGGEETFAATADRVFGLLTDRNELTSLIPDLVSAEPVGERGLKCVVRPGFSFLRGTLNLDLEFGEVDPPRSATMIVRAKGIGQSMRIESRLDVAPRETGSALTWHAHVDELKGLIAAVSPALIQGSAQRVIGEAWRRVRERLGEGSV